MVRKDEKFAYSLGPLDDLRPILDHKLHIRADFRDLKRDIAKSRTNINEHPTLRDRVPVEY